VRGGKKKIYENSEDNQLTCGLGGILAPVLFSYVKVGLGSVPGSVFRWGAGRGSPQWGMSESPTTYSLGRSKKKAGGSTLLSIPQGTEPVVQGGPKSLGGMEPGPKKSTKTGQEESSFGIRREISNSNKNVIYHRGGK